MNYYEHHIGDYAEATSHLSLLEDAVYSRLIRKYYATEKPLPADMKTVQRLVGARTDEEREAVVMVLEEFFCLQEDGWHNHRCDDEIERYRIKQEKARNSANARWKKPAAQPDRSAEAEKQEPQPYSELNPDEIHTDCERSTTGQDIAMRTHSDGNALQSPDTRHQTPEGIGGIAGTHHEGVPDPDPPPPANRADPNKARANEITAMLRKRGAALQAQDPRVLAWAAEGISDAQLLTALELAQRRRADQQSAQPVNAGFLDMLLREPAPRAASGSNGRRSFDPSAYINQRIHDEPEAIIIDGECQRLA
ncbi:YdaU family protein [Laribacter hongkongensis]|uniref:YdaU family protein n=1 Tax=Laribacter hongkongensis TaxID=168471 RepID=UPI001EFE9539|nr:YdaU family protein [Laribacter hongkongensis]MCG9064698.1 YdaU family protein [Laribacter hongkongensis]